jgi:hypothetical protein
LTLVEWLKQQQEQQPTKNKKNKTKVITADLADSPPEPDNIPIASQGTRFYSN